MCGFAGVVTWDEKYRVTRDTLEKMSRAIAHRGPDGEGFHLTRENEPITPDAPQIGLAFRRLAILDPDPRSNQPFHIGPLTLVFNGEIYNFRELKSEISKLRPDYHWRTTGDTEVLLMAYEVWREKCVEKLNGMFAFAVWDESKKELFLARDRMGQKPLYLWHGLPAHESARPACIAFASELPALRKLDWFDAEVSDEALLKYLMWGYVPDPMSMYKSAGKLPPAHRWTLNRDVAPERYFDPNQLAAESGNDASVARASRPCADHSHGRDARVTTKQLVEQAVLRQLVSDVPLGCFLSGGIDSSVITAAMKRAGGLVHTFSIGFDDPRYDESEYARSVAKHLGTRHESFVVHPRAANELPRLAQIFGEPFADSSALPTHYLSRETRTHVKVALSGDGGDELFGGYDRYRAVRLAQRWGRLLWKLSASPGLELLPRGNSKSIGTRLDRFRWSLRMGPARRYCSYHWIFRLWRESGRESLFKSTIPRKRYRKAEFMLDLYREALSSSGDVVTAALATDRIAYLPNDLLTKVDRCSMLHGLEVRSPFMDHELVQFAAGLTTDQLLKGGPKRMLREAFARDLPDFVFKRKKMGFAVPIGEWFRGELRPMLRDNLFAQSAFGRTHFNMKVVERLVEEHETQRVDHSQRLYALLMLELWWQQQGK